MAIAVSYFFFFAIFGLFLPYMTPILLELGFPKHQVGLLHASFSLISVVVPALIGRASDRWLSADRVIRYAAFLLLIALVGQAISARIHLTWFVMFMILFAVGRAPMVPLLDTLAMRRVFADAGAYARIRVMGSIGFVCAATLFSALIREVDVQAFFVGMIGLAAVLVLTTFALPREQKPSTSGAVLKFWSQLDRTWWWWLLAMVLHWMCFGPYHYGFTLLLQEQGIPDSWTGSIWSIGVVAEILVFLASRWFFERWSTRTLLFVALIASLVRWLALGLWPHPWVIIVSQVLHGLGFALFYAAAIQNIHRYCRGHQLASYQTLFATCLAGGGNVIGMGVAGYLHELMPFHQVMLGFVPVQIAAVAVLSRVRLSDVKASFR